MIIAIEPIPKKGARGDRDTRPPHPYLDYRIHVVRDHYGPTNDTVVQTIDGYDNWWTTIRNPDEVKQEAATAARRLARNLGAKVAWLKYPLKVTTRKQALAKLTQAEREALGVE